MAARSISIPPTTATQRHEPAGRRYLSASGLRHPRPVEILVLITALGAALRFGTLNVQSIWLDESATLILVHRGFSGMLTHLSASESAPPLYYMLVWTWAKVFGAGPVGFRSFSALVGTLTVPVLYVAGRQISPRVGLWAAMLAAVNPAMYYYSQEARCYALLIFFSAIAFVFWQRALLEPTGRKLTLWACTSILALLTHYFAAFLFIPETLVLAKRSGWRRVAAPAGAVVVVGMALVPLALAELASGKVSWIEEEALTSRLAETAKLFLVGPYGPLEILSGLLVALLAVGATILLFQRGEKLERAAAHDVLIVAIGAIVLPLLLAVLHVADVFDGRNVIAAWVAFAVFIAIGLGVKRGHRIGSMLGVGVCMVSVAVIVAINSLPAYQRDDWRGIADVLKQPPMASRIIIGEESASAPLSIYLGPLRQVITSSVSTRELDFVALRTRRSARSPLPPVVPIHAPRGFQLASLHMTEAYAVAQFLAPRETRISVATLRRLIGQHKVEVIVQQAGRRA